MSRYWLHLNHPNNKAVLHVGEGCAWVKKAAARHGRGEAYGPERGDANGSWSPFADLRTVERAQEESGKANQKRCSLCWG